MGVLTKALFNEDLILTIDLFTTAILAKIAGQTQVMAMIIKNQFHSGQTESGFCFCVCRLDRQFLPH